MNRRSLAAVLALSLLSLTGVAHALEIRPFDTATLAGLQGAGKPVAIHFHADWCPTCKFNLAYAIETDRVRSLVEANRVVPLLADWTGAA